MVIADEVLTAFVGALFEATGGSIQGQFWVREAEVYRDHLGSDAIGVVTSLKDTSLPGAGPSSCKKSALQGRH